MIPLLHAASPKLELISRAWNFGKDCAETVQPMPDPLAVGTPAYEDLKRFYKGCHDVSVRLLELFALALGVSLVYLTALQIDDRSQEYRTSRLTPSCHGNTSSSITRGASRMLIR